MKLTAFLIILIFITAGCNSTGHDEHNKHKTDVHKGHENQGSLVRYTCPMHPKIVQDQPGQCPICKMDLEKNNANPSDNTEKTYSCPMHPDIIQDKPGICPKCKMDLVASDNTVDQELDILLRPTDQYVVSQIKTIHMQHDTINLYIQANGKIFYDTRQINSITSKVSGRIEKLYVRYTYQPLRVGHKLLDIYSKELTTEQENFIYLLNKDSGNRTFIKTAETRLMLQGLSSEQIQQIRTSKKKIEYVTVYSPFSGHLHELNGQGESTGIMSGEPSRELQIKEGMYVQKGQVLFNVYNTRKIWAELDVYSNDFKTIRKGQKVLLNINNTTLSGKNQIDFIVPEINPESNTLRARVYLTNPDNTIKIGSNVRARIDAGTKTGFFIPLNSVIDLGINKVVFIKENNYFRACKIKTGIISDNLIEVLSGITKQDAIAANAQLLMDSESFIKTQQ